MNSATKIVLLLFLSVFPILSDNLYASTVIRNHGISYRSVNEIAAKLGMKTELDQKKGIQHLKSRWTSIKIQNKSRVIEINKTKVYLGFPIIQKNKKLYMPELDWQFTLSPTLVPGKSNPTKKRIRTIVIDPGHGGKDPGAINPKQHLNEKDLTLQVSEELARILKKKGFRVYLTRSKDKFIELSERPRFAKKKKADLFLSLHFNSSTKPSSNGIETFAYTLLNQPSTSRSNVSASDKIFRKANRYDSSNILLSYNIQRKLINSTKETDRGVKRARFTVLEDLQCPGTLVELGFLNNPTTAKKLKNKRYLTKLADSVANGVLEFRKRFESGN